MRVKNYYNEYPAGHFNIWTNEELYWQRRGLKSDIKQGQNVPGRLIEQIEEEMTRRGMEVK